MADNINNLITLGINKSKTEQNIQEQIKKILETLSSKEFNNIVAGLNISKSAHKIQEQLNIISKNLDFTVNMNVKNIRESATNQSKEWQAAFKASLKEITAPNVDLKPLNKQYAELEKYYSSFNAKNLNGIDYEIKQREIESKSFAKALKSQMEAEVAAEKAAADLAKQNIVDDTLKTKIQTVKTELLSLKDSMGVVADDPDIKAKWDELYNTSNIIQSQEELANLNAKIKQFKVESKSAINETAKQMAQATVRMLTWQGLLEQSSRLLVVYAKWCQMLKTSMQV